jgi:hypothetical protein
LIPPQQEYIILVVVVVATVKVALHFLDLQSPAAITVLAP